MPRKSHVHPMLSTKKDVVHSDKGLYYILFDEHCVDNFLNYFHMLKSSFDELLHYIRQDLTCKATKLRRHSLCLFFSQNILLIFLSNILHTICHLLHFFLHDNKHKTAYMTKKHKHAVFTIG